MALRLRTLSLTATGLSAAQNQYAIVNDTDTGWLMISQPNGGSTWIWNPYLGPALGLAGQTSSNLPASNFPAGTVIYDPAIGPIVSDGNYWQVPARTPENLIGLQRFATGNPVGTQLYPYPRLPAGNAGLTATVSPSIGTILFTPVTVPIDTQLVSIAYKITTLDAAGAALVGLYQQNNVEQQYPCVVWPGTGSGSIPETATGWYTYSPGTQYQFYRGERIWIGYLRTAGAASLLAQTTASGPGDLAYLNNSGTMVPMDLLTTSTGAPFSSLPTLVPSQCTWQRLSASSGPQFFVSFG